MIRGLAGSAVATNIAQDKKGQNEVEHVRGSVQAVKEGVELEQRRETEEVELRLTSHEIRQKILSATTPSSKSRVVEELNVELTLVDKDIDALKNLGESNSSPERSFSVNSNTAVPMINPSTQDKLQEKYELKDQIETGLKTLKDRERRQHMLTMAASTEEIVDPYAPSESSNFLNKSLRQSIDQSRSRSNSSFSSASSQNRGGSRGSLYRSTHYDRQKRNNADKSRRQVFTEMAMRDIQFMLVTGKHVFSALSDYELMEGFN